jgi:hypothetical protein
VLDGADQCPDTLETANGYEDGDGCPDELPKAIKQYTGVIKGINFKVELQDPRQGAQGAERVPGPEGGDPGPHRRHRRPRPQPRPVAAPRRVGEELLRR